MLFNSIEYAFFLPIVFVLYWFVFNRNLKCQNLFVVAASYLFYGWWDWRFLVLIAFTTLCSYYSGLLIEKYRSKGNVAKRVNAGNIIVNLLVLGVFKYYNFFVSSFAAVFLHGNTDGLLTKIILPVGISFYTFQALSYSIDVYRNKLKPTSDIVQFFAFVSFFPQLVAGPIERATNLLPQFAKPRTFDYRMATDGMRQILWGLFKKIVIADNLALYVNAVTSNWDAHRGSTLLLSAIFFAIQLYCDFSGYSDVAIGTAKLFGIRLMRNFDVPQFSRDVAEFWRRWHISLNSWFGDYVLKPLNKGCRSKFRLALNILLVFLLSGLWHGASWTFVCWGLFIAVLYIPLIFLPSRFRHKGIVAEGRKLPSLVDLAQMVKMLMYLSTACIFFRMPTIGSVFGYFGGLFSGSLFTLPWVKAVDPIVLVMVCVMFFVEWIDRFDDYTFTLKQVKWGWLRYAVYMSLIITIVVLAPGEGDQYIYFQF